MRLLAILLACAAAAPAPAERITVAVAANFLATAEAVSAAFSAETGHRVDLAHGSTGKLYAQIRAGAPFDLFLSADRARPARLVEAGLAAPGDVAPYAVGRLALVHGPGIEPGTLDEIVRRPRVRFAIADPDVAPYGAAARDVLRARLGDAWAGRVVLGESVGQASAFIATGNVDAAFLALAQARALPGAARVLELPDEAHAPIRQDAALLARAAGNPAARAYFEFLAGDAAREIIAAAGYEAPRVTLGPVWLTLLLAATTTAVLLLVAVPLAWWLAHTRARVRPLVEAVVAVPLVLPPTVLGFYLLVLMSPQGALGAFWVRATGDTLAFSFPGLVAASIVYSMPFAVQPLQTAFQSVGRGMLEAAGTLGAGRLDRLVSVALPMSRRGLLAAAVLSFAHTVGEFGVVLMVGGNIPGRTRVISIEIYSAVETLDYRTAHLLSAGLLAFSLVVLTLVYLLNLRGVRAGG